MYKAITYDSANILVICIDTCVVLMIANIVILACVYTFLRSNRKHLTKRVRENILLYHNVPNRRVDVFIYIMVDCALCDYSLMIY